MITEQHNPLEEEYLNCIRCGLCLSVCPTYREHLSETASPRGRVALARRQMEGRLQLTPNLSEQMYSCFACMACDAACPVGIRPAGLALRIRQRQEQAYPARWKQMLFGRIVSKPRRLEFSTLPLRLYELLGLRRLVQTPRFGNLIPARTRDLAAMLPPLPQRPLRQVLPEVTPAVGKRQYHVGFFLGCAQSLLFADQSAATVRVLARNGCAVVTPREVVCCGMPAAGYGRLDLAQEQARHNIALFEKTRAGIIVTDCATCGSTLKDYGALLAKDPRWAERAKLFGSKVRDISEFLASIPLEKPQGRVEARVTYHDPCHLRRGQGVWKQPRQLLQAIDGLELVELPEADWCCGSAGSQLITHYGTSVRVLDHKMDNLASTGAGIIASGCPGCQLQLNAGVHRRSLDLQVVHPIQLLDQAYNGSGN